MVYKDNILFINIEDRINEDPLRMLRAVRFATTLGFTIEEELYRKLKENKDINIFTNNVIQPDILAIAPPINTITIKIIGSTISFAGKPNINALKITPSNPPNG